MSTSLSKSELRRPQFVGCRHQANARFHGGHLEKSLGDDVPVETSVIIHTMNDEKRAWDLAQFTIARERRDRLAYIPPYMMQARLPAVRRRRETSRQESVTIP